MNFKIVTTSGTLKDKNTGKPSANAATVAEDEIERRVGGRRIIPHGEVILQTVRQKVSEIKAAAHQIVNTKNTLRVILRREIRTAMACLKVTN